MAVGSSLAAIGGAHFSVRSGAQWCGICIASPKPSGILFPATPSIVEQRPFTLKALTEIACNAEARILFNEGHFRLAIPTQTLFTGSHWSVTGRHCHRAQIDTSAAIIAELGFHIKRGFHPAILASTYKTQRLFPKGPGTRDNTTTA